MDILEQSYNNYRSHGFIMQKALRHKKFASAKGGYAERDNEAFSDKATGYVAICPPNIIIVDSDSYEEGCEFGKFIYDLGYAPEASVVTPSGGQHYFFENPHENLVVGNHNYNKLDIYGGYQSVVPIVGTVVKNKQCVLNTYEWADDIFEEIIINEFKPQLVDMLKMRERTNTTSDDEYDDLSLAIKEDELPESEVLELCKLIPIEEYRYDTGWLKFAIALYDRYEGTERGLEIFQETCKRNPINDPSTNEVKWNAGHFKGDGRIKHTTLRSLANEGKLSSVEKAINEAESFDEIEEILTELVEVRLNTTSKKDETIRDELVEVASKKAKEITGKPQKVKLKNSLKYVAPESEVNTPEGFDVYRLDNKYLIRHKSKVISDVTSTMLRETLSSLGIFFTKEDFPKFKNKIQTISAYRQIPDYTLTDEIAFNSEEVNGVKVNELVVRTNPLINVGEHEHDKDILQDFLQDIWNGKAEDIVRLIGLTIKSGEQKLNRLMLVAPSNTGKSEIFNMLNFQKITMKRLLNGMRADKGIGSQVIDGIRRSALLLIDEANSSLEAEIKDMDKELHIDQFGSGGTQILPLHFTALTSTHKTATRNNSDELYNRFLQIELTPQESKHTIMQSKLFLEDSDKYTRVIKSYLLELFRNTLRNEEGTKELRELQSKYRLPTNNDLDELLFEIGEDFISETKKSATHEDGSIHRRGDEYFYKRKGDVTAYFEDRLGEVGSIDVGKYTEKLVTHFLDDKETRIKLNGKVNRYYKVTLNVYSQDETKQVESLFDDLDINEL